MARIAGEHVLGVALLLVGLVVGAYLRDARVPGPFDVHAWMAPHASHELALFIGRLERFRTTLPAYLAWDVVSMAVLQYAMYLNGLYDRQAIRRPRNELLRFVRSALLAGLSLSVLFFAARPPELGRTALVVGFSLTVLVAWGLRTLSRAVLAGSPERVLLLGSGAACREVARVTRAEDDASPSATIVGRVGDGEAADEDGIARLGAWEDLGRVLEAHGVDRLLIASSPPPGWNLGPVVSARLAGVQVSSAREFAEGFSGEVLEEDPGVEFLTDATSRAYGRVSRLADVVLATVGLVVTAPIVAAAALGVLVTSGRPILFSQERVGFGGRTCRCWKLRTMRKDAEAGGPSWSTAQDPRIEPFGRFLRRWRIDELPQLVNVLRGDMAFVGPRPEQPFFVEQLSQQLSYYYLRHVVRPGLTGWAQVRAPYGSSLEDARRKLRFDLFYIKHRSPYLDLAILFDTVRVVLLGKGR
jgi:exopolysaccharide biosynthesis polyprenyl glycosylphosphotransferase